MERPHSRRKLAIGFIASAVAAGAVAVPVIAQASSGPGSSSQAAQTRPHFGGPMGRPGPGGDRSGYDAAVAAKLGISTSAFESAEQSVRGSLAPPSRGATGATAGARAQHRARVEAALAAKLGVTTAKLMAAEDAARQDTLIKNLPTLVSYKVITQAQSDALTTAAGNGTFDTVLKSIEIENLTTHLTKAVSSGRLTQAQADKILADAKAAQPGDGPGLGLGFGFRGPRLGGPGGPGHWGPRGAHGPNGATGGTGATGDGRYGLGSGPMMAPNA